MGNSAGEFGKYGTPKQQSFPLICFIPVLILNLSVLLFRAIKVIRSSGPAMQLH